MKLSTRARYAMRMMLAVARETSDGKPVSMTTISRETTISKPYLEQLAIPLKAASLLRGRAGRAGGYLLGRPAKEIRVREIVEAAIGRINIVECVNEPDICVRAGICETRVIWGVMNHRIRTMLDEYSLEDLEGPAIHRRGAGGPRRRTQDTFGQRTRTPPGNSVRGWKRQEASKAW